MITTDTTNNRAILQAAGQLFAETGYGQVEVESIAEKANVDPSFIYSEYSDKAGLCLAWLISLHQHSEEEHAAILESDANPIDKVSDYFDHLEVWMEVNQFEGCPFTRTVNSLGTGKSPEIRREVRTHKQFVADFFGTLSQEITSSKNEATRLGEQLYLLHTAATTEAKNLQALWPIQRAKEIALAACEASFEGKRLSLNQITN